MIINAASQASSIGQLRIGNRNISTVNSLASGLSLNSPGPAETQSPSSKNSIYANFEREMSRRLNEAAKKNQDDDQAVEPSVLVQSLSGAMGEIEQIFDREAATEVMAKILIGTAGGLTEDDLLASIQNGLAGLSRLDPNGTKVKNLTEGFNRDLALSLDQDLADQTLASRRTLSLSYALGRHFGSLTDPEMAEKNQAQPDKGLFGDNDAGSSRPGLAAEEIFEMSGFDETGVWNLIEVKKPDEAKAEELREAAEAGLDKAAELTMLAFMNRKNGERIFSELSGFLKDHLQDKESAAFVDKCIGDTYALMADGYGSSPKLADLLSQVYSKVAADGDADNLALFEKYINNEFKEAVNPILAEMQQGGEMALLPGAEVGELQFKGLSGLSPAGENDVFSLNWGYKDDPTYDRSITKRYLQEDIRGVKAVKEEMDAAEQTRLIRNWDDSDEEKRQAEAKEDRAGKGTRVGLSKMAGSDENREVSDLRTTRAERFAEENRRKKLDELMDSKFGQLSDSAREELEKYLSDNFGEEEAQRLLEHTRWSNNLMTGLAGIHRDLRESGTDEHQVGRFMNFLNGTLKNEVGNIASELGGLTFDGWQASEAPEGGLEALIQFKSLEDVTTVAIMAPDRTVLEEADSYQAREFTADQILNPALSAQPADDSQKNESLLRAVKKADLGYLVDLLA